MRIVALLLVLGSAQEDFWDDDCMGSESCALSALQLKGQKLSEATNCPMDLLAGDWVMHDALGFKTVTVSLSVSPRPELNAAPDGDVPCTDIQAVIKYIGKESFYDITVTPMGDGKYHVKYTNHKVTPVYFHEGTYDSKTDKLTEDLTHMNADKTDTGCRQGAAKETCILVFHRS